MDRFLDEYTLNDIEFNTISILEKYYKLYNFESLTSDDKLYNEKTLHNFMYIKISNNLGKLNDLFNNIKNKIDNDEIPNINFIVFLMFFLCEKDIEDKNLNLLKKYNYYSDLVYNVILYDNSIENNINYKYYINYFKLVKNITFNKEQINNIILHIKYNNGHNFDSFFNLFKTDLYISTIYKVIDSIESDEQKNLIDLFVYIVKQNRVYDIDLYNMCTKIYDCDMLYYFIIKILENNLLKNIDVFFEYLIVNFVLFNESLINNILILFVKNNVNYEFLKNGGNGFGHYDYIVMYNFMNKINRKNKLTKLTE